MGGSLGTHVQLRCWVELHFYVVSEGYLERAFFYGRRDDASMIAIRFFACVREIERERR